MIERVWGKADGFNLTFLQTENGIWTASVPADLEDGQYAVELYCIDDSGNTAFWTGVLYLSKSENASVRIIADKNKLWLISERELKMTINTEKDKLILTDECELELVNDKQALWLKDDFIKLYVTIGMVVRE